MATVSNQDIDMIVINSISGGRSSCMMAMEFPADYNLFALVEVEAAAYKPGVVLTQEQKEAFNWVRKFRPGFWATAEDNRTLVCLHKVACELENREGITVVAAGNYAGLINPVTGRKISTIEDFDSLIEKQSYLPNQRKRLCTQLLKVEPIFHWCARNLTEYLKSGEKVKMRIGFRADEVERTINLYFRQTHIKDRVPNPDYDLTSSFKRWRLPNYLMRWWDVLEVEQMVRKGVLVEKSTNFNTVLGVDYRTPEFPLIEAGIFVGDVVKYWSKRPNYTFPPISNCVGCFHHSIEQLQNQWSNDNNWGKMEWMANQEEKRGKLFGKTYSYRQIQKMPQQMGIDFNYQWSSCDSGTCTD